MCDIKVIALWFALEKSTFVVVVIQIFLIERRKQDSFAENENKSFSSRRGEGEQVGNFFFIIFLLLVMYIMWQQKERDFQVQGE